MQACIFVKEMAPLVLDLLHESVINALNCEVQHKVEEGRRNLLISLHLGTFILQSIFFLVEIIEDMVVDFLVELDWRVSFFKF